jgi:hypothetical protein
MYSQAPVLPRALETNPYTIRNTNPLGVESATFEAKLEKYVYGYIDTFRL